MYPCCTKVSALLSALLDRKAHQKGRCRAFPIPLEWVRWLASGVPLRLTSLMRVCRDQEARVQRQLLHDVAIVTPGGVGRDAEPDRDLLVAQSLTDEPDHLPLVGVILTSSTNRSR